MPVAIRPGAARRAKLSYRAGRWAGSQAAGLNNSGNTLLSAPQATINLAGAGNGVGHVEDLADNSTKNNGLNAVDTRPQGVGDFGQSDDKQAGIKEQTTALINRNGPDGKPIELGGKDATFTDLGNAGGKHTSIGSGAVAPEAVGPQGETSGSVARDKIGGITSATEQVIASSSGGKTPPPAGYDYRPVSLTDISAIASTLTASGSPVRLSDYPLPASNNGYFVANKDPKSPYLIVTNPKLDGLGNWITACSTICISWPELLPQLLRRKTVQLTLTAIISSARITSWRASTCARNTIIASSAMPLSTPATSATRSSTRPGTATLTALVPTWSKCSTLLTMRHRRVTSSGCN